MIKTMWWYCLRCFVLWKLLNHRQFFLFIYPLYLAHQCSNADGFQFYLASTCCLATSIIPAFIRLNYYWIFLGENMLHRCAFWHLLSSCKSRPYIYCTKVPAFLGRGTIGEINGKCVSQCCLSLLSIGTYIG